MIRKFLAPVPGQGRLDAAIERRPTAQRHCREMTVNPLGLERYTVVSSRAPRALRDPAPPARSPWRGFGGAGPPRTERRISMSKSAKKQMSKKDRKRLEQLFRMIGSPNASEAENARR